MRVTLVVVFAWCGRVATAQIASKLPTPTELLDKTVHDFSPTIPSDVDPTLKSKYESEKKFAEVQNSAEFSW